VRDGELGAHRGRDWPRPAVGRGALAMRAPRASRMRAFAAKLHGFLRRERMDDVEDEIQEHLRLLTERFMAQGMSKEEAAFAARRQFGNTALLQEDRRDLQTLPS